MTMMTDKDEEPCEDCDSPRGRLIRALADNNGDQTIRNHTALEAIYGPFADAIITRMATGALDEYGEPWNLGIMDTLKP